MSEEQCPEPELCRVFGRHIHSGRVLEIWQDINVDPQVAEQRRALWRAQAQGRPQGSRCCGRK